VREALLSANFEIGAAAAVNPDPATIKTPRGALAARPIAMLFDKAHAISGVGVAIGTAAVVRSASNDVRPIVSIERASPVLAAVAPSIVFVTPVKAIVPASAVVIRSASPQKIERITFAASLRILDTNDSDSPIGLRIPEKFHPSTAVDPLESEISRIARQRARTFKTNPTRRLPSERANTPRLAAHLDFGCRVNADFNRALSFVAAVARHSRSPRRKLSAGIRGA
jgi:hypothetical protein